MIKCIFSVGGDKHDPHGCVSGNSPSRMGVYLTEGVDKIVFQKSIPAQIYRIILSIGNGK
jgi:hypothetical protein